MDADPVKEPTACGTSAEPATAPMVRYRARGMWPDVENKPNNGRQRDAKEPCPRASDAKRRKMKRVCVNCGGPVHRPRRGPAARFCRDACRKEHARRRRKHEVHVAEQARSEATDRIRRRDMSEQERLAEQRTRIRAMRETIGQARELRRVSLMVQLKTIAEHDPANVGPAPGAYVTALIHDIDRDGHEGDAERLLEKDRTQWR